MCLLIGCAKAVNLTEEEGKLISRYAAGKILNYSEEYDGNITPPWRLPSPIPTPAVLTPSPEPTAPAPQVTPSQSETSEEPATLTQTTLNELYNIEGIHFSYNTHEFTKQYPKKSAAPEIAGMKEVFLIAKFRALNTSNRSIRLNTAGREQIQYALTVEGETYFPELMALGIDNRILNAYNANIKAGQSDEIVLIYELPSRMRNSKDIQLSISENGKEVKVIV
jgi:hypothetical protein